MRTQQKGKYIHRLEGRMWKFRLQDVFNGNDVVMLEVLENFQLSQCAFGICHHFKCIGDLFYRHLLACRKGNKNESSKHCSAEFLSSFLF